MFSLKSDEMTAVWPNDSLTLTFYGTFSNSIPNWTSFESTLLNWSESDEMWLNGSLTFTFMPNYQIIYQAEQFLWRKLFDAMFIKESDEMTAVWPNNS